MNMEGRDLGGNRQASKKQVECRGACGYSARCLGCLHGEDAMTRRKREGRRACTKEAVGFKGASGKGKEEAGASEAGLYARQNVCVRVCSLGVETGEVRVYRKGKTKGGRIRTEEDYLDAMSEAQARKKQVISGQFMRCSGHRLLQESFHPCR